MTILDVRNAEDFPAEPDLVPRAERILLTGGMDGWRAVGGATVPHLHTERELP